MARTSETALLLLEHFVSKLKKGGRAAIIVKNTVLSNDGNASRCIRKLLLEKCELEWILDLPPAVAECEAELKDAFAEIEKIIRGM